MKIAWTKEQLLLKKCVVTKRPAVSQLSCCADHNYYRPVSEEVDAEFGQQVAAWLGDYSKASEILPPYDHMYLCAFVHCARCGGSASEQWFIGTKLSDERARAVPLCIECDIEINDMCLTVLKDPNKAKKMVSYIQKKAPWLLRKYMHYIEDLQLNMTVFDYA